MNRFQGEIKPGEGNLQIQALIAAVVGPLRMAHGLKRSLLLPGGETALVTGLAPAARHCRFIAMYLPANNPGPVQVKIGMEQMLGTNSALSATLEPQVGVYAGVSYSGVLLPGDQLYAQAEADVFVVISETDF